VGTPVLGLKPVIVPELKPVVVVGSPPAAVTIVSRSVLEIMTSTPAGWGAVAMRMGSAPGLLKLLMMTAMAPALSPLVTLSENVVVPRLMITILPLTLAAFVRAGAFPSGGTAST